MTEAPPSRVHALSALTAAGASAGVLYAGLGYAYGTSFRNSDPAYAAHVEETFFTPTVVCAVIAVLSIALALYTRPKV